MPDEKKELVTATMGMSNAEFGAALIGEAKARRQKERLDKSVAETQTILGSIEECDRQISYFTGWKATRQGQLDALEKGEFSFDKDGLIVYNDRALNRR